MFKWLQTTRERFVFAAGLSLILFGLLMLLMPKLVAEKEFPWVELTNEFGIAIIGAGALALSLRIILDKYIEEAMVSAVDKAALKSTNQIKEMMQKEIKRRTDFDPSVVYTERYKANDILEIDFEQRLLNTQEYISVGVTGKYVLLRLQSQKRFSRTCRIQVVMIDPKLLTEKVFAHTDKLRERIAAVTGSLIRLSSEKDLNIEIFFSQTVPALRIDILSGETFIYAYDDFHKAGGQFPDAAQFPRGTQWDRTARQIAQDAIDTAVAGWRRGIGAFKISDNAPMELLTHDKDPEQQINALLVHLALPTFDRSVAESLLRALQQETDIKPEPA